MIFAFSKLFLKGAKKRLRPSGQAPDKGVLAFVNKPAMGLGCWFLVWLTAFLLQMVANSGGPADQGLGAGRASRLTPGRVLSARGVSAGAELVPRGQMGDAVALAKIRRYQALAKENEPFSNRLQKLAGDGLLLLLGVMVTAIVFRFVCLDGAGSAPDFGEFGRTAELGASGKARLPPRVISSNSMILLFLLVSLLSLAPVKWLLWMEFDRLPWLTPLVEALMPLALAPLLMSILVGPLAGVVVGFWVSFVAAGLADYRISVFVTGLIVTAVTVRFAQAVRTRSKIFRIGLWAGLAGAAGVAGFAAIRMPGFEAVIPLCLASIAGGVFSALAAMLLLPLLELIFGISTDISLLELSDLEHPLLKRLAIEAPGTYHHSLMVANLTQAAVTAIGGNALRAGICAYFHDIGKLVKPAFFSENIQYGQNPHDDLSPSMSTLLIISHVKEGVNLALRYKLPRAVVEAIQQHHGSGLVFYFYHKANVQRGEAAPDTASSGVKEEDFRYPGPKPQSREIAVLSLADAIEAASRSLEKITPGNMEDLVRDVMDSKLRDGQLDACDLTLAEINAIRRALILTLSNILHGRVAYPSNENIRSQSADETPPERS
ncbi:MAG: HDIG domain-containing metalloprotein [Kiritimatiellia bacterium]|jgi:hypothetical protein